MAAADSRPNDVDERSAGDRTGVAEEAPEGVGRQVVLRRHEAVDVLRREPVHQAVAPEGQEDRRERDRRDAEELAAEADEAADARGDQQPQIRGVGLQGRERRGYPPADRVAGDDEQGDQREEHVGVHERAVALGAQQRHLIGVVDVEVHRGHVLHHEVDDDLGDDEGHHLRQPPVALHRRAVQACSPGLAGGLLVPAGRELPEDQHAHWYAGHDVPVEVLHGHLERHAELAQDADHAKAQRGPHDGPGLRDLPERRDDAQEGALEDAQADAGEPVGQEDVPDPLAVEFEHEEGRDGGADEHDHHRDVHTLHRGEAAKEDVVTKPGDELPVVHEDGGLREGLRPVSDLSYVQLSLKLLLQRPDHGGVALEHA
mmetsp:Transcript_11880/g.31387  ORF Transcript_11880/g.31387 Transcript_11880/m.31387 type:complete len:372 (+) Transcript_11880:74-1189(+)